MNATEFRATLKRLGLNQSSFAATAKIPLRTVQSWALGERRIPSTVRTLIEKIERMPTKDRLVAVLETLPYEALESVHDLAKMMVNHTKVVKALRDEVDDQRSKISKMDVDLNNIKETCSFLATKVRIYEQDIKRRAESVIPFNT